MKNRRDDADVYAETLVMPEKPEAVPASGDGRDPLALYEEYARELRQEAAATPQPAARRRAKR